MTSKNHPEHNHSSKKYYDVSFDTPNDFDHVTQHRHQTSQSSTHSQTSQDIPSSKWDHFYDNYHKKQPDLFATTEIKKDVLSQYDAHKLKEKTTELESRNHKDDWRYTPPTSNTVTGQSSKFIKGSINRVKSAINSLSHQAEQLHEERKHSREQRQIHEAEILRQQRKLDVQQKQDVVNVTNENTEHDVMQSEKEQTKATVRAIETQKHATTATSSKTSHTNKETAELVNTPQSQHHNESTEQNVQSKSRFDTRHLNAASEKTTSNTHTVNTVSSDEATLKNTRMSQTAQDKLKERERKEAEYKELRAAAEARYIAVLARKKQLLAEQAAANSKQSRYGKTLPSPEDIARERENRLQQRVAELESLNSPDEVVKTHRQYIAPSQSQSTATNTRRSGNYRTDAHPDLKNDAQASLSASKMTSQSIAHSISTEQSRSLAHSLSVSSSILNSQSIENSIAHSQSISTAHSLSLSSSILDSQSIENSIAHSQSISTAHSLSVSNSILDSQSIENSIAHSHSISTAHSLSLSSSILNRQSDTHCTSESQRHGNARSELTDIDNTHDIAKSVANHSDESQSNGSLTNKAADSQNRDAAIETDHVHPNTFNSSESDQDSTFSAAILAPDEEDTLHLHSEIDKLAIVHEFDNLNGEPIERDDTLNLDQITEKSEQFDAENNLITLPLTKKERRKRARKERKQAIRNRYALSDLTLGQKVMFGFNVFIGVMNKFLLYFLLIAILLGAMAAGAGTGYFAHLVGNTTPPTREEMAAKFNTLEQLSSLHYANGDRIANVQADVVRSISQLDSISPYIRDGLISIEDNYFYEHVGVMPKAILRAVIQEVLSPGTGTGGSTLTQQLVKQRLLTNDVTFFRKANEILLALRVENYFSKDEILAAYLNVSPFGRNNRGENIAGIAKAAEGIFGKSTKNVTIPQAAFLVGLPQNPYTYTPYTQNGEIKSDMSAGISRMKDVLYSMYRNQKISKEEYDAAMAYDITQDFIQPVAKTTERQSYLYTTIYTGAIEELMKLQIKEDGFNWNQVVVDDEWYNTYYESAEEKLQTGGYKVYSTIDQQIYEQLNTSAATYISEVGPQYEGVYTDPQTGQETSFIEKPQTGLVIIDNATGRVLGFVAGTNYNENQLDHAFSTRRSPGSTIKPIAVYGPAMQNNLITPATMIANTEFSKTYPDGTTWTPTNYGGAVQGGVESVRQALYQSHNLPTIRLYDALLNANVNIPDYLTKMGFAANAYPESDTQNLAFSIGGVTTGPTVFEQTRAFSTFANNGQYIDGYYIDRIEDAFGNIVYQHSAEPVQVFSEDTNYLMISILRDVMKVGTGTTASANFAMGGDWIAKTGTSEDFKDIWFIAATPKITIGSWLGYDNRYQSYSLSQADGYGNESVRSQAYVAKIMNELSAIRPDIFGADQGFVQPNSVSVQSVLQNTGTLPGSIIVNNSSLSITGPTYQELFKVSVPAPMLTYNFALGASDNDTAAFWGAIQQQMAESRREAESNRRSQESGESNENSTESSEAESADANTNTQVDAETTQQE